MSKELTNNQIMTQLQISLTKVEKDLEYLIKTEQENKLEMEAIKQDINELRTFYQRWKGGAVVLMALGGMLTWFAEFLLKALPLFDK